MKLCPYVRQKINKEVEIIEKTKQTTVKEGRWSHQAGVPRGALPYRLVAVAKDG